MKERKDRKQRNEGSTTKKERSREGRKEESERGYDQRVYHI